MTASKYLKRSISTKAAQQILAELDAICETEHGMSLESVVLREPLRNARSRGKYEALLKRYGIE